LFRQSTKSVTGAVNHAAPINLVPTLFSYPDIGLLVVSINGKAACSGSACRVDNSGYVKNRPGVVLQVVVEVQDSQILQWTAAGWKRRCSAEIEKW
jgi:hypothetical protein